MSNHPAIKWTNKSVTRFANNSDPSEAIQQAARALVLKARESGWEGPPFNPLYIARMLDVQVEANSSVADARLIAASGGPRIEFNPQQPRERVRFSIAHEVAHMLFSDWAEQVRNRNVESKVPDGWQLEMLCNLAASEFVMPIGSLTALTAIPPIEDLMRQRLTYDVSAEAFLIRLAKVATQPIGVFFASPFFPKGPERRYKIDYYVGSPTAPTIQIAGALIPTNSSISGCTAIGYTARAKEAWATGTPAQIEYVGIPAYPGSPYPRVAGLITFETAREDYKPIEIINGNVLEPRNGGHKIICQLVNDRATKWGGGVSRKIATRFPIAEGNFTSSLFQIPQKERLGKVIFSKANDEITIASLIAQEGFGPSLFPRIRYAALKECLEVVTLRAKETGSSIHMPKIGTGGSGGDWGTIEEMLDDALVRAGLIVTVYVPPPKRKQLELF